MRGFALLTFSLVLILTALVVSAPLSEARATPLHQTTTAQIDTGGIFDKIDSLLNNFTKRFDLNSLVPQQTATPSVNITSVKTVDTGQPQVIVTVKNGKIALDGVRIDVIYKNSAGANVLSNTTVLALKTDETRSITFTPQGLSPGTYKIGVIIYKSGTNPSNQATPPYDAQQNAATLTIASSASTKGGTGNEQDAEFKISNAGDVLAHLSPWVYFIIAMTGLITVALFFVFSQNRSGEDRYEDDHFKGDGYGVGDSSLNNASALSSVPPTPADSSDDNLPSAVSKPRRSRRIEVTAPEGPSEEPRVARARDTSRSSDHKMQFDSDGFVVGDVTSKKALTGKTRGKKGA